MKTSIIALLLGSVGLAHAELYGRPTVSKEIPTDFISDWCFEYHVDEFHNDSYVLPSWNSEACAQGNKIISIKPDYMGDQREDQAKIDCYPVRVTTQITCAPSGCASVARVQCDRDTYFSIYRYKGHLSIERIRRDDNQYCDAKANFMSAARMRRGECKFEEPKQ